jgi:hypothetical protein
MILQRLQRIQGECLRPLEYLYANSFHAPTHAASEVEEPFFCRPVDGARARYASCNYLRTDCGATSRELFKLKSDEEDF